MRDRRIGSVPLLTAERLRELIDYDPETGLFTHRMSRGPVKAGDVAGCGNGLGYRRIRVDGPQYRSARLAYLWMTGEWPPEEIDHINRNPADDRWDNLRAVSPSQNLLNRKLPRSTNMPTGVQRQGNRFEAKISVHRKLCYLGMFSTPEAASAAYQRALQSVMR